LRLETNGAVLSGNRLRGMCFTGGEFSVGYVLRMQWWRWVFTLFLCVTRRLLEGCGFNYGDEITLVFVKMSYCNCVDHESREHIEGNVIRCLNKER